MNILVTGGAGFIGATFVRAVLGDEYAGTTNSSITVLDALTYCGNRSNLAPAEGPRLRFVYGDICDAELVDGLMPGHDAVVHFAAETHVDRSIRGGAAFVRTNVLGTQVLLEAAVRHGVHRFVHVSTDEVYGSIESGSWREGQPLAPNSPYSAAKAGSDHLAMAYHRTHGLPVMITRCSNNYGPYQYPEKIIPFFLTTLMDGGAVPLYGDGGNVRDWLHVDDHCQGIARVLADGRPGDTYHLGGGLELTNRELTERLLQACDVGWEMVRQVPDRKGHDRRYSLDYRKAAAELGYQPAVPFETGLEMTFRWYAENRSWWEPLVSRPVSVR